MFFALNFVLSVFKSTELRLFTGTDFATQFSTKPLNKNSKQGKQPVRRNSLTGVNITAPLSEMNGKSPMGRQKSASQERKDMNKSVAKSVPVKRRNSGVPPYWLLTLLTILV
jgi:hypothetical protein